MQQGMLFNRTVVEQNEYLIEFYKLANQYPRMDDINDAIKWQLSRRPDIGGVIQAGSSYRVFETFGIGSSFMILYLFDEATDPDHVYLYDIWPSDE